MSAETETDLSAEFLQSLAGLEALVNALGQGGQTTAVLQETDKEWLRVIADMAGVPDGRLDVLLPAAPGAPGAEPVGEPAKIDLFDPLVLRSHPESAALLEKLLFNLKAMAAAHVIGCDTIEQINDVEVPRVVIHNRGVAEKLKASYDLTSFDELFGLCQEKGVFALKINQDNGLVTTAEAEENWDMSGRQWVTDTVRCGDIERSTEPLAWTRAMLTLCDFYNQPEEMEAMRASIADPEWYRQGGLLNGVAHIFIPHSLKRDSSWFNNKRLESHGLALKAICDTVLATGLEPWGFSAEQLSANRQKIADTIVYLASYLKAINTNDSGHFDFGAPSAGAWEEIPFPAGLTWDTEAIRSSFESLHALVGRAASPTSNVSTAGDIGPLLLNHQHGEWLHDPKTIEHMIKLARGKVIDRLFGQVLPMENPQRPLDCSLAFITTSTIRLGDDVITDVANHFQLLETLGQHLVRSHGIIRYAPFGLQMEGGHVEPVFDSYLADNYWLLPELRAALSNSGANLDAARHYGSSDCSTNEDYLARVKLAREGTEAQWCFVSVMAEGYGRQVLKLQRLLRSHTLANSKAAIGFDNDLSGAGRVGSADGAASHAGVDTAELEQLIAFGLEKAGEYLSRAYARITTTGAIKANGHACPGWAIPEAYEFVSPLGADARTHLGALPGANTPLAWGQSSLYSASVIFRMCLQS